MNRQIELHRLNSKTPIGFRNAFVDVIGANNLLCVFRRLDCILLNFFHQICVNNYDALVHFKATPHHTRHRHSWCDSPHIARRKLATILFGFLSTRHSPKLTTIRLSLKQNKTPPMTNCENISGGLDVRLSARVWRHDQQIILDFGTKPIDMSKTDLGLTRVSTSLSSNVTQFGSIFPKRFAKHSAQPRLSWHRALATFILHAVGGARSP